MPKKLDHSAACEHLSRVDRHLARIIAKAGPCLMQQETTQSIFDALLEAIVYQQLHGKAAATILGRVKALFPENTKRIRTRRGLVDAFPSPEQILTASDELLRSAGLSRNKMLAIRDLAAKTVDGTVPTVQQARRMSDDELVERLTAVRGSCRRSRSVRRSRATSRDVPAADVHLRVSSARTAGSRGTAASAFLLCKSRNRRHQQHCRQPHPFRRVHANLRASPRVYQVYRRIVLLRIGGTGSAAVAPIGSHC